MVHGDGAEAARGIPTQLLSSGSGDQRSPGERGSRQVGSTAACARPASTISAVQRWELNLPTRQACRRACRLCQHGLASSQRPCSPELLVGTQPWKLHFPVPVSVQLTPETTVPLWRDGGFPLPLPSPLLEAKNKKLLQLLQIQLREGHKQVLVHLGSICMLNFLIVTRRATFLGIAERLLEE